jgi:hypothetical protein
VYPLYHVLRGIAQAAGKPRLEVTSSHPGAVQALAWQDDGGPVLWLANLTGHEQRISIAGGPSAEASVARLDLERFVTATSGPDGLARTATSGPVGALALGAYAVARLQMPG